MIRAEYLDVSVKIFPDYSSFMADKYYDASYAFLKLNIRVDMYGLYNGTLIVNDSDNIIKNEGDCVIRVDIKDYKVPNPSVFIFGTTHNDLTLLQNGDAVRSYNLVPFHDRRPHRFSRKLTNNAIESMEMMLDDLYAEYDLLKPKMVDGSIEAYVPSAIWVKYFYDYMQFVRKKGINPENDNFVFCWYDEDKITVMDYENLMKQEPLKGLVMEEDLVGNLGALVQDVPVFKYEFMTELNNYDREYSKNAVYITTSNEKNGSHIEVFGDGSEVVNLDRSCIYREMTYENGYEEMNRIITLQQYDAYAKFRTFGDMRLKPGKLISIKDAKGAIKEVNIIDDVLYEINQAEAFTHVYMMTTTKTPKNEEISRVVSSETGNYPYAYGESSSNNYLEMAEAQKEEVKNEQQ